MNSNALEFRELGFEITTQHFTAHLLRKSSGAVMHPASFVDSGTL